MSSRQKLAVVASTAGALLAGTVAYAAIGNAGTVTTASSSATLPGTTTGSSAAAFPLAPVRIPTGTRSAAEFLQAGGGRFLGDKSPEFDKDPEDFDITYNLALAVLAAKPDSPVSLLTKGDVGLTLFLPVDGAWRGIAIKQTNDQSIVSKPDKVIYDAVLTLGIDNVEKVLLFHVVPETLVYPDLQNRVGQELTTALGQKVRIGDLLGTNRPGAGFITIVDNDPESRIAVVKSSLESANLGSRQAVHEIRSVLRPAL